MMYNVNVFFCCSLQIFIVAVYKLLILMNMFYLNNIILLNSYSKYNSKHINATSKSTFHSKHNEKKLISNACSRLYIKDKKQECAHLYQSRPFS